MKTTSLLTGFGITTVVFLSLFNFNVRTATEPKTQAGPRTDITTDDTAFGGNYMTPLETIDRNGGLPNTTAAGPVARVAESANVPGEDSILALKEIVFIEDDEDVNLGFDTETYLPADFDAYAGMEGNLAEINFVEDEEPVDLGFDTKAYLPVGFDPYDNIASGPADINYIREEEPIHLGFDVKDYLPADFDPYAKIAADNDLDLNDIIYIEDEEPIEI